MSRKRQKFLVDFGLSQEDPLTEQLVLDIHPKDRILSLASAGDVPLSLAAMIPDIQILAADISMPQIMLCRIKHVSALHLGFPDNGFFLGFGEMAEDERARIYYDSVSPLLSQDERSFWDANISFIRKGVINSGRFEQYIGKMRFVASFFMGSKNLAWLIRCRTMEEQNSLFDTRIATRKSLRMLFRVAFHPAIYRKRGLQDQALIHADKTTGERFYSKFRDFCTASAASENYFLQYFLTGKCHSEIAFPAYLKPENRKCLSDNTERLEFKNISFQSALSGKHNGFFNKIHLSNLGDWLPGDDFSDLLGLFSQCCDTGTLICYRFLQKNHFAGNNFDNFSIDTETSETAERKDRFPFYGIRKIEVKKI